MKWFGKSGSWRRTGDNVTSYAVGRKAALGVRWNCRHTGCVKKARRLTSGKSIAVRFPCGERGGMGAAPLFKIGGWKG